MITSLAKSPVSLDADEFIDALGRGDSAKLENSRVLGTVRIRGKKFPDSIQILHVSFEGDVDFTDSSFECGADFTGCTFAKTFSLRNVTIGGDLDLSEISVTQATPLWKARLHDSIALDLTGLEVEGNFSFDRAVVMERAIASGLKIRGDTFIKGSEFAADLTIDNSEFEGSLYIGTWNSPDITAFFHHGLVDGDLNAINIRVSGAFILEGLQIQKEFRCWGSLFESSVFFSPCWYNDKGEWKVAARFTVGKDLNLAATKTHGNLDFYGVRIYGELNLQSAETGTVNLTFENRLSSPEAGPCRVGRFWMVGARVRGNLKLPFVIVDGPNTDSAWQGINIASTIIEGNLSLWEHSVLQKELYAFERQHFDVLQEGAYIVGHLKISQSEIKGECQLGGMTATGVIQIEDSHVYGDITFRSQATLLKSASTPWDLREQAAKKGVKCALAAGLDLTMTRCDNDVDLTGLELISSQESGNDNRVKAGINVGSIAARGLQVQGELLLFARFQDKEKKDGEQKIHWNAAGIPGTSDFRMLKAFKLVVSWHSFERNARCEQDVKEFGLQLSAAEIGELKVVTKPHWRRVVRWYFGIRKYFLKKGYSPPVKSNFWTTYEIFPRPIDLHEISVRSWNIGGSEKISRYISLLKCDYVYRQDTYARVEQALRNGGNEDGANAIYIANKIRHRRQVWTSHWRVGWIRGLYRGFASALYEPFHIAFRFLLGFGTAPGRLLFAIIALWALMLPIYSARENFEPSLEYRRVWAMEQAGPIESLPEEHWRGWTPIFVSLQYHMPLIALVSREEWKLTDKPGLHWTFSKNFHRRLVSWLGMIYPLSRKDYSGRLERESFSPEDLGMVVSILNWMAWPLVLTYFLRKLLR